MHPLYESDHNDKTTLHGWKSISLVAIAITVNIFMMACIAFFGR
jgi:hypothetical protein